MSKHKLAIDQLEVHSFEVSDSEAATSAVEESGFASCNGSCPGTCNAWCTIVAACPSWTVCTNENN